MDTRQLARVCAVVELKSFSQAAERLGVTQPAVSLQVRSLEKRLGRRLLDRSGRRVEPTEAGLALYRGAQRMLQLEEQLVEELEAGEGGELGGTLAVGASTGPGSTVVPFCSASSSAENPGVVVSLSISDTQSVVERVAERELELGVVGAARRHRGVVFEPLFRGRGRARGAARAPRSPAERHASTSCAKEPLIVMQEGAGVRQVIEDELRSAGTRLKELEPRLELGLQESVKAAVVGRLRRDLHLARRDRGRPRRGHAGDGAA
jgi:DNA-binding transcriptional LysR family regulator